VNGWLKPDGLLFLHVFSHRSTPYRFDVDDRSDWVAQHFFTGGVMPSHDLARQFDDLFTVAMDWRWSGEHYARTALQWLENFDANRERIDPMLAEVYGRTPSSGRGAGGCSSWRRPACSAIAAARNGASATIACVPFRRKDDPCSSPMS
jgi:hypothetical protein